MKTVYVSHKVLTRSKVFNKFRQNQVEHVDTMLSFVNKLFMHDRFRIQYN